jgi:AcrR family transcriptional regulator
MSEESPSTGSVAEIDWRRYDDQHLPPTLSAALRLFVEKGYHAATTRTLADAAGLSVPGLYHHYHSKQAILVAIMNEAMEDLYRRSLAALAEATTGLERLDLYIECLVLYHAYRRDSAFVAASELRGLEPENLARHIAARDRQQALLTSVIRAGAVERIFDIGGDAADVSRAIITMCTGVSQWYHLGGELTPPQLAERYIGIVRRILAVTLPPST